MSLVSKQRWYAPPPSFANIDRMGESSVMGAISSISATSSFDLAKKLTLTFWIGSSKGPDTTLYPNKVESNSVVGPRDGTATPTCRSLNPRLEADPGVKA